MKVEFRMGKNFSGVANREVVDLPDYYSDGDIEDAYQNWLNNFIDNYWIILEENDERDS